MSKYPVYDLAIDIVEQAMMQQPRNLQEHIGPSEIGSACLHCVAAKLAGWEQQPEAAWLPYIGTAMHAQLERVFEPLPDWLTETRVSVGKLAGRDLPGTADLFHIPTGTSVDFKIVGATTLRKAKRGPSPQYRTQGHSYGLGHLRAGREVHRVAVWYMPRNAMTLRQGYWWEEDFQPLIALEALDRAESIVADIRAFSTIEERDDWISGLPRDPDCFNCKKYPDWSETAGNTDSLEALLGV
ncbi:MAG: hypothetical protein BGN98_13835 [Microbacterium sp. 69-7]|uniref:hypothetical protein n=1 Tax=Microbacterium sp. 69-7 TaxID=1895784 RepID=UPI0009617DB5|nr:hypothetical protein [Microbacterium sp. 69-7]OJU44461.1 MAG: hypothetical protein BGN98_13835 [Microbacterium sp. 69-7]